MRWLLCFKGQRGPVFKLEEERLSFAINVYCIWQERDNKIFRNKFRTENVVIRDIESYIQAKAWYWHVTRSFVNWLICKEWMRGCYCKFLGYAPVYSSRAYKILNFTKKEKLR